jgi:hypothetical protein
MTSSKIGFEIKIVIEDLTASDVTSKLQSLVQQINGLINLASAAPSLRAEPLSAADAIDNALEAKLAEHKPSLVTAAEAAATTRKTRTKVAAPAPVEAPLKQGDKTTTIRNFVLASSAGVTPKEILRHLRENYTWARESTTLANTVHTSLNNMLKRNLITFDEQRRTYAGAGEIVTQAPARTRKARATTEVEAVEAAVESVEVVEVVEAVEAAESVEVVEPTPLTYTDEELAAKADELRAARKPVPSLFDNDA